MPDVTLVYERPDGSATVIVLRLADHVVDMHPGACTRAEVVSCHRIDREDRV